MIQEENCTAVTSTIDEEHFRYDSVDRANNNYFETRTMRISSQPYSLPFSFILRFKKLYEGRNVRKQGQKYYWVFTHLNGCPVSFKKYRFFTAANQKILPDCFSLCKQTYELMLCVEIEETFSSFESMVDEEQETEEWQVFEHSLKVLEKNFVEFHKFLMKIGFISTSDKGCRKFQLTKEIVMARIELNKILHIQNDGTTKSPNFEEGSFEKVKPEERFSEQTRDSYGRGSVESLRNQLLFERGSINSVKSEKRLSLINCAVKKVKRIEIENRKEIEEEFSGGYFVVKNYQATIVEDLKREQILTNKDETIDRNYPKMIAIKRLRKEFEGNNRYVNKVKHEMDIIKQIKNKTYICTYYESEEGICLSNTSGRSNELAINEELNHLCLKEQENNNKASLFENSIIMESLFISLKEIQERNKFLNQFQVIVQLLQAVISLHKSGIVHRDIKPANIMFNELGHLKLIDFSESIECWREFSNNLEDNINIGLTLPYSPLECSSHCASGYSNFKIDNWSVGLIISELILGKSPLCYSKSLSSIIKSGWSSDEFQFCYNLRINSYHDTLLLPIKVLALKLMSVDQEKRLNLEEMQVFMNFYQKYICAS